MTEVELLLTDEFVNYSKRISSIHLQRKKLFAEFKEIMATLEGKAHDAHREWEEWKSKPDLQDCEMSRVLKAMDRQFDQLVLSDKFIEFSEKLVSIQQESNHAYQDFKAQMDDFDNRARQIQQEWENWVHDQLS